MKMRSNKEGWIIIDGDDVKFFKNSLDAWMYVFLMKEIRPNAPQVPKTLYPVRTLDPRPSARKKRVVMVAANG